MECGVTDAEVLAAALLHDTVEDTGATLAQLEESFGANVAKYVAEVSDDKSLAKGERKRMQVEHAGTASDGAKLIKIADKVCNFRDLQVNPLWGKQRTQGYFVWGKAVVDKARGVNVKLDAIVDDVLKGYFVYRETGETVPCIPEGADMEKLLEEYYALCTSGGK